MKNNTIIILRIVVSPIILLLMIVGHFYSAVRKFIFFLKYGGEFITFEQNERPTIYKIYQKLKENK